ncbi:MAG: hypothetical protein LBD30_04965, partial [Verrucomicrobiales bacterium]|nr:hypothetical protein [Verrucomicrobiales bacterium]
MKAFCQHMERGSALVVVLAMVVLLTALTVAFFSSARLSQQISASSANQIKADLFAQGAADCIIGEFKHLIVSGSLTVSGPEFPNLVASSGSGSESLTSETSANGRKVSLARWNLPRLLPSADVDDLTPPLADSQAPRWINVTRDGGADGEVFGRYAYMVYNEGGLLDANYAGSVTPSGTALTVWNRKGSTAFADLTKIGLSVSDAAQLAGWRDYASVQAGGALPALTVDWQRHVNVALRGVSGSLFNNQSDQRFTSRRQLIDFFTRGVAQNAADRQRLQTALQYLGTFSVAPNRPTYRPADGEPGVNAAVGLTVSSTTLNVPFRSLTVSGSFTRNDGSTAADGEPLVARRFPLSYLLWLTYQGPSATVTNSPLFDEYVRRGMPRGEVERLRRMGTAEAIRKYFGLVWNEAGKQWRYDSTLLVNNSLAPLVSVSGREPNFFELLKAGIHTGAVAQLTKGNATDDFRRDLDSQIVQIGANIIDQSQPENFPTVLVFKNLAYWGVVDLPYLYGMTTVAVLTKKGVSLPALTGGEPRAGAVIVSAGEVALLDVPIIWNPHQANTNADSQPNGAVHPQLSPRNLRIVISNKSMVNTSEAKTETHASFNVDNDYRAGTANNFDLSGRRVILPYAKGARDETLGCVNMGNNDNALEFTASATLYREPTPLLMPDIAGSGLKAASGDGRVTEYGSGKEYVGFRLDTVNSLYPLTFSGTNYAAAVNYIFCQSGKL